MAMNDDPPPAGGAAELLGGDPPAGDPPAGDPPADPPNGGDPPPGDLQVDPEWYAQLSGETGEGESASNRDLVKSKGWKTLDDVVKSYREAERAVRDGGKIKIPGEGASDEEKAAFRKAIGVPENVEGYKLPEIKTEGGEVVPLDQGILGALLPKALERGVPADAMNGLIEDFVALQLDAAAHEDQAQNDAAAKWVKDQGTNANARIAAIDAAGKALGLSKPDLVAIRGAIGAEKALDMFAKLGEGIAEDVMLTGGRNQFGINGREAQGELDKMKQRANSDRTFATAVTTKGTAENQRWERLQQAATAYAAQQERMNA